MEEIFKVRSQQNDNNNWSRASKLSTISSMLCPHLLTSMIEERLNLGSNAINIGAMNCYDESYLDNCDDAIVDDEASTTMGIIEDAMNGLCDEEDIDAFFDAKHLSKVWQISYEDAKHTIDATSQHGTHQPNPVMNQNYTTNDQML